MQELLEPKSKYNGPKCPKNRVEFHGYCHPRWPAMSDEEKNNNPSSWVAEFTNVHRDCQGDLCFHMKFIDEDWAEFHETIDSTKTWFLKNGTIYRLCYVAEKNSKPVYSCVRIESGQTIKMEEEQIEFIFKQKF